MEGESEKNVWTETDGLIKDELYRLMQQSGVDINVLAAIGSWKDSQTDESVLKMLQLESNLYRGEDLSKISPHVVRCEIHGKVG